MDGMILEISDSIVDESSTSWTRCIVGFFAGNSMPYYATRSIALRVWKSDGIEDVISIGDGFFLFCFGSEDGVRAVLERGPWMFGGRHIILQQ